MYCVHFTDVKQAQWGWVCKCQTDADGAGTRAGVCQLPRPVLFPTMNWMDVYLIGWLDKFLILCQECGCRKRALSEFWEDHFSVCNDVQGIITTKPALYRCSVWDRSRVGNGRAGWYFIHTPRGPNTCPERMFRFHFQCLTLLPLSSWEHFTMHKEAIFFLKYVSSQQVLYL